MCISVRWSSLSPKGYVLGVIYVFLLKQASELLHIEDSWRSARIRTVLLWNMGSYLCFWWDQKSVHCGAFWLARKAYFFISWLLTIASTSSAWRHLHSLTPFPIWAIVNSVSDMSAPPAHMNTCVNVAPT